MSASVEADFGVIEQEGRGDYAMASARVICIYLVGQIDQREIKEKGGIQCGIKTTSFNHKTTSFC